MVQSAREMVGSAVDKGVLLRVCLQDRTEHL